MPASLNACYRSDPVAARYRASSSRGLSRKLWRSLISGGARQPGSMPVMSGSSCAMPLWQSMQVFSPVTRNLRVDFRRASRLLGEVHRRPRNGSCGTPANHWPSAAPIRAWRVRAGDPETSAWCRSCRRSCPRLPSRPASCGRSCRSSRAERGSRGRSRGRPSGSRNAACAAAPETRCRAFRGSEVQNFSVLVTSSAVLKAPQNSTPQTKPPSARKPRLRCALGRLAMLPEPDQECLEPLHRRSHFFSGPTSSMSLKVLGTSGWASVCWTWQAVQKYRRGVTSART